MKVTIEVQVNESAFSGLKAMLEQIIQYADQGVRIYLDQSDVDALAKEALALAGEEREVFVDSIPLRQVMMVLERCAPSYRYSISDEDGDVDYIVEAHIGRDYGLRLLSDSWRGNIAYRVYYRGKLAMQVDFTDDRPFVSEQEHLE